VYCQLGRTNRLQIERESFFPREEVLVEIEGQLANHKVDYITFVGDGEPTLSADIGWMIRRCKDITNTPIAVITNGSLLFDPDVRNDLIRADVVIPSLDAGSEEVFEAINRPHGRINYDSMVQGLVDFRREYDGQIWLEVMLVRDLNDTDFALRDIRCALDQISPDRVYVMTPIRPPAESWVKLPQPGGIVKAQDILGTSVAIDGIESGDFGLESFANARQAILEIGSRHPLRVEQADEIEKEFGELGIIERMIKEKELLRVVYGDFRYLLPGRFVIGESRQ
jgi:wyosine [tRNA(Phe)-imidazoG37] synthetase (radical SAM superfamily)